MALPPLAHVEALADWIGEPISEAVDTKRAEGVLSLASAMARRYAGATWGDAEVPDGVAEVVLQVAARGYTNPEGWRDERVDDWGGSGRAVPEAGLFLTASEKSILDEHRPTRTRGIGIVATTKVSAPIAGSGFVPTEGGPPFPWY